jgi:hypothetical protein
MEMIKRDKGKKGTALVSDETLELILAGAGVILLLFLLYILISPYFSKQDETLKSYLQSLNSEIGKANSGGVGEFMIYQDNDVYLVYFGNKSVAGLTGENWRFFMKKSYKNNICFCRKTDVVDNKACNPKFCTSLDRAAVLINNSEADSRFIVSYYQKLTIKKGDGSWIFEKVQ